MSERPGEKVQVPGLVAPEAVEAGATGVGAVLGAMLILASTQACRPTTGFGLVSFGL